MQKRLSRWRWLILTLFFTAFAGAWYGLTNRTSRQASATPTDDFNPSTRHPENSTATIRVETARPVKGGLERLTTQPGSLIAFESAQLFSKVSGYLSSLKVDIGDHMKRGQVLAEIDAPELVKAVDQAQAALEQAKAQLAQASAHILTMEADRQASAAAAKQAEAEIDRAAAARGFREKQYDRIKKLFELKSIDERLVDEKLNEMESARAAERLAHAGLASAKALINAASARVVQAKADENEARSKVEVAEAALAKARIYVDYLKIVSPYDGVVTKRNFFRGDFIQSADGGVRVPLLVVDRTDIMRVVIQVPDRDVPFTNHGADATVEIDALPGTAIQAKVTRVADAEDHETRTMRAEIDIPNRDGKLRQGMYGQVTIHLGALADAFTIPSSCLVGDVTEGKAAVYIARDGAIHLQPVRVGRDDGVHIEILRGLATDDNLVQHPTGSLYDGARVSVVATHSDAKAAQTHDAIK